MVDENPKLSDLSQNSAWRQVLRVITALVVLVLVFDLAWQYLLAKNTQDFDWSAIVFELIEDQPDALESTTELVVNDRVVRISVGPIGDTHLQTNSPAKPSEEILLIEQSEGMFFTKAIPEKGVRATIGPLPRPSFLETYSPYVAMVFYSLLAVLLWLWMYPILKGLDTLSSAMRRFTRDHRASVPIENVRAPVDTMAKSFEYMASQIRSLIDTQQELGRGLSHELRTPLARAKFALASAESLKAYSPELLHSITQDIEEIESLTNAMLEYSRIQAAQPVNKGELFHLLPILDSIRDGNQWRTTAKIYYSVTLDECWGDSTLIKLALSNLIANAARYAKEKISVLYKTSPDGEQTVIVNDDGPGIPVADREQSLRAFCKVNVKENGKSSGFGLGLALVRSVMELHSGKLRLGESPEGGLSVALIWTRSQSQKSA